MIPFGISALSKGTTNARGENFPSLPLAFADGVFPAGRPSRTVLDHITSTWGVLILLALSEGEQRWSDLRRRAEGISEKVLAQTLKTLERDGLVSTRGWAG
ncbi:DNA-binding HxlR family transcriptional regulator [Pseudarthrobacter defluvii]|nr:DNA-binding HxlR family transcriptional regulator [Pseudarthrobacter defluvii]